jgi:2-dehydropantoate 2-reductase
LSPEEKSFYICIRVERVQIERNREQPVRIGIMGAGALGCYIGGRLAAAGNEVWFIARGAQLAALRDQGLRIESPLGHLSLDRVLATSDPSELGAVEFVLFLVKLYDTESAARAMMPLIGPKTWIISFQNGVDGWGRIGSIAGKDRIIGGVARLPCAMTRPGVVRHNSSFASLALGELDGDISDRCKASEGVLDVNGLEARAVTDIDAQIWEKFIMLATLSGITGLTRLPIGSVLANELCAGLYRRALEEAAQVGLTKCPTLQKDVVERQMKFSRNLPPLIKASMLDDLEHGKRLELNDLSGAVVRLGREAGIATPVHAVIQAALQPYAEGRP